MGRRILAIVLLIAFGFPVVAPAFEATADPEASLPPCCRSHGAHHCAMMHSMMLALSGKPAFVPLPCPLYPTTTTPPPLSLALTGQITFSTAPLRNPARQPLAARCIVPLFVSSANLKRGPPTFLA